MREKTQHTGFTLMQVLVGLAITAVLFSLLLLPLAKSFDLTRRGRAQTALQGAAQVALRQMWQEIAQALVVYADLRGLFLLDGDPEVDYFGRLDIVLPDPNFPDNTVPSERVVTYYGRLRDPALPFDFQNPEKNPRVLYRAEYLPEGQLKDAKGNPTGTWAASNLEPFVNTPQEFHNAVTPLDGTDLSDLVMEVEQSPDGQKSVAIVLSLHFRDPVSPTIIIRNPDGSERVEPHMLQVKRRLKVQLSKDAWVIR